MRIISIVNQKGGCGKTTTAVNLSACLSLLGRRTLLIDLDPQALATASLTREGMWFEDRASGFLLGRVLAQEALAEVLPDFYLIPSGRSLAEVEEMKSSDDWIAERLRLGLFPVAHEFEFVTIDTPPGGGRLSRAALLAADEALITIETSFLCLQGVRQLLETLRDIKLGNGRPVVRALATMYDGRTTFAREVLFDIENYFGDSLLKSIIRQNVRLKEAQSFGLPISEYDRKARGFEDYMALAEEIVAAGRTSESGLVVSKEELSSEVL